MPQTKPPMPEGAHIRKTFIYAIFTGAMVLALGAFSFFGIAHAATGINRQISFQGKVTNTDGTNVTNASYTFLFCLYTTGSPATACTTGANNDAVWRESKSITVTDGIFQTNLGDTTTLPGSVDFNTDNIYLGINFNANGQMTPLVRFTAAPYAMNADKVHGLTVTDTTGTLTIANGKTVQFSDAFTTTGAFPLTLTATASTTATLPSGTITLADLATSQVLTNKTIGSTGLVFSGAATDITTASGESLVLIGNGAGIVDVQDTLNADTITTDTGGISIAAGQSYTGAGAVTLASGGSAGLTIDSASGRTSIATGDFLSLSVAGVSGAAAGDIWYDSTAQKYKINENGTTKIICNTTDAGCGSGGGLAIGNAITSATSGSILFAGSSNDLQQNNAKLFWDNTNYRLGIGAASPANPLSINSTQTSGTFESIGASTAVTLAGALTGLNLNLATNYTATGQSVAGANIALPAVTNTGAGTYTYTGVSVSGGAITQNTGAGVDIFGGISVTNPNITQTTGTIVSYGVVAGNGSITTGGTQSAFVATTGSITTAGTQNGLQITASGVGAGTLNGINIGSITAGAGTENAINIGTGWDYGIYSATTGNSYFAGNIGIGDASPDSALDILSTAAADTYITIGNTNAGSYNPAIRFELTEGAASFTTGVDEADSAKFKIATGTTVTGSNQFTMDSTGAVSIANLNLGMQSFEADAGLVTWIDMPVSSTPTVGTVEGYIAQLDGNPLLTIYGESDGAGSIQNSAIGIGTIAPTAGSKLAVSQSSTSTTASSTLYGTYNTVSDTGVVTATGDDTYGNYTSVTRTGGTTAGTFNIYGDRISVTGDNAGAATSNAYGLYVAVSGADNNYSGIFTGGNFGIGTATPTSLLSVGATSQFQVNSTGAIAAATGIASSGTITFSALSTNGGLLWANGSGTLAQTAAGTAGQALISGGAGAPTYYAPTLGSVLFAGTGGILSQDNANYFYDATNHRLGLGTATPGVTFDVAGAVRSTGNLYLDGGTSNLTGLNDVVNVNKSLGANVTGSWSTGAAGGSGRSSHTPVLYNGKIYSWGGVGAGGSDINTLDIYDIASNTWSTGATGGTARETYSSALYNGKIYSWGGWNGSTRLNTLDIYDIGFKQSILSIQENGQDTIDFQTGSQMFLNSGRMGIMGGNIGIGTATPGTMLDVAGTMRASGIITANGGISLAGGQSMTAGALSYLDLGSITQGTTAIQGFRLPQAASATPSNPTSGEGYLAWDAAGNQLITYNGSSWSTVGGGSVSMGSAIGSATQGSILFAGASGVLAQDNANFFWDDTNNSLKVGGGVNFAYADPTAVPFNIAGSVNTFLQANIQNKSTGTGASTDWIATADNGTDTANYIDMGINGSGYTAGVYGGADDAYLYNMGNNLLVGTGSASKALVFMTGGTTQSTNERARIDGNGNFLVTGGNLAYTNGVGLLNIANTTNFTGVAGQVGSGMQIKPAFTLTEPGSGAYTEYGANIDLSNIAVTAGAGTSEVTGLHIVGTSDADAATVKGIDIGALTGTAAAETALNIGAGWDTGLLVTTTGTGTGIQVNTTGTGSMLDLNQGNVDRFTVAYNGGLTINGADSSIVKTAATDFNGGTVGSNLTSTAGRLQLSDGTPAGNVGTLTTASQPLLNTTIGAGAMSITRPDGKYLIINGGATGTTSLYDPMAGTITNSQTIMCNNTTTVGIGAIALPMANGLYTVICGVLGSTTTATSIVDPMGSIGSRIGPPLLTAVTGAGTVAYKRPNGKYVVALGTSATTNATAMFDPVAGTLNTAGPSAATGNWAAGSLALPMPDSRALFVNGGSTSTTNIYNPNGVSATIGTFTVGPSLDGNQAANTCGINGAGSVAIRRQDGKYVILSKGGAGAAAVSALYDPSANTMTCRTSNGPSAALGDGAHAIPLQNGKFLIFRGANTTDAWIYSQDTDSFAAWGGTTPNAITTGAHSILRPDGSWQIITGTTTVTNNFNTGLPMSDPFPSAPLAGAPTSGGSCTNGLHSYYVTFVTNGVESELGQKSNIVNCNSTLATQTVGLSGIPIGPVGTTARKVYRTVAGDTGLPQLVGSGTCVLGDNSTTSCSDTLADGSLGSAYSVTAATTWYTSEAISNSYIGTSSTLKWTAQLEAVYSADRNQPTNTAFKVLQFFVRTAQGGTCSTALASAPWQEIQNSGDSIRPVPNANCAQVAVHFNRAMPKKLYDDRGTWIGNNSTVLRYDYTTPALFDYTIDNSAVVKKTSFDFSEPTSAPAVATTVPTAPTSNATSGTSGACTNGAHYWFVSYVINGVESLLSPASSPQTCSGGNQTEGLTAIPIGPSGTTARKIYRTAAALAVTDTPFYVGIINDNSTVTFSDGLADTSLGAAFAQLTPSGPVATRAEGTRVESNNNQLTLPWGRITPTSAATTAVGVGLSYMGHFDSDHPSLNNTAGPGTFVIARDDKTFLVVEGGGATADLYDPATQTFTNQTNVGDKPTATVGLGAFAIKRPNGKFLIMLGNNSNTTNIYDQYAAPGSRFTAGPAILGSAIHEGALAMQNADGTWTILPGNANTSTSVYDPVRNTMTVGPLQTTGTNYGAVAIPLQGPNANIYKVMVGTTLAGAAGTATMNYNANTKVFTAGFALAVGVGNGGMAFQRQDGYWVLLKGESAANTLGGAVGIINPYNGAEAAGTTLVALVLGRGSTVIPRSDGTFLITSGNSLAATTTPGSSVLTAIYYPWGGVLPAATGSAGSPVLGTSSAGPAMAFQGTQNTAVAAPTTSAPALGGTNGCDTGTHLWRYTQVINGVETALSLAGTVQTCTVTTLGQETLTAVAAGPVGTTARKIYRTKAGTTSPYFLVTTLNDNTTTTYPDSATDASLGAAYWSGGPGDGAVSFQRPDGKFVTIFGGASWTTPLTEPGSTAVNVYDAGWYPDGQYLSEQMQVPALAANSTLDWQQTSDQYVRMAARTASSQTALGVANYTPISSPGGSIGNAANDTWAQVQVNFRRDFPTYGYNQTGVYLSSGLDYTYRNISIPTVNSFTISNGQDLMTLSTNGQNVLRVTSGGNIMSSSTGGFFSGGADLAENYTSGTKLLPGEVVSLDPTSEHGVKRTGYAYQSDAIGVVSTTPGFVAGGYTEDSYPIALAGRVPVKFSTENGMIYPGDRLAVSSIPGVAMRATKAGRVIGIAMTTESTDMLTTCDGDDDTATRKCGTVMMFVNLMDYSGTPVEVAMADSASDGVTTADTGADQGLAGSDGSVRLATAMPTKQEQILAFLRKTRDSQATSSQSELYTDRVSATNEIITPTLYADTIFAKSIKADSIEGLSVFTDQLSSLSAKYAGLSANAAPAADGTTQPAVPSSITIQNGTVTLSFTVFGKLEAQGGMIVGGDAQFDGNTVFNRLVSFFDTVVFKKDVSFEKAPTFASDTAGFAVIAEGSRSVDVTFDTPYAKQPIVTVSLTNDRSVLEDGADAKLLSDISAVENDFTTAYFGSDIKYVVTGKSVNGFTILLSQKAPRELDFSWMALAVNGAKTFHSAVEPVVAGDSTAAPATDASVTTPADQVAHAVSVAPTADAVSTASMDVTDTTTPSAVAPATDDTSVANHLAPSPVTATNTTP